MIKFQAILKRFPEQGEKTGWTYFDVPAELANQLKPGVRLGYRVKGKLDAYEIKQVGLIPMGDGNFIIPVNATMRKGLGKRKGATIKVELKVDESEVPLNSELLECLEDEPLAKEFFMTLTRGHRNYFSKWIDSAKTEPTKTKRIAQTISALAKKQDFGTMLRSNKKKDPEL